MAAKQIIFHEKAREQSFTLFTQMVALQEELDWAAYEAYGLAEGVGFLDPELIQVPFPDGFQNEDVGFDGFERALAAARVDPERVAGVISETYQGGGASFMPVEYAQALRAWCDKYGALLCFDEVQAGFGRCGRLWGFEHYGVVPDLFCMGKGLSSSLPVSGVLGRQEVMDLYGPNEMTSTHSGNPICTAAALANIEVILNEGLVENSDRVGAVLHAELAKLQAQYPDRIGAVHGKGLVAGIQIVEPGTKTPDGELAWQIVYESFMRGLMMFAPVGFGGGTVKIAPPLCLTEEACIEGCTVLAESTAAAVEALTS